jgi:hypothetical protein
MHDCYRSTERETDCRIYDACGGAPDDLAGKISNPNLADACRASRDATVPVFPTEASLSQHRTRGRRRQPRGAEQPTDYGGRSLELTLGPFGLHMG